MLRKYVPDYSHILQEHPIVVKEDLTYEEKSSHMLDIKEQVLRKKVISIVKRIIMVWMRLLGKVKS